MNVPRYASLLSPEWKADTKTCLWILGALVSAVRANVREAIVVVGEGVVGLKPNRLDPIGPGMAV